MRKKWLAVIIPVFIIMTIILFSTFFASFSGISGSIKQSFENISGISGSSQQSFENISGTSCKAIAFEMLEMKWDNTQHGVLIPAEKYTEKAQAFENAGCDPLDLEKFQDEFRPIFLEKMHD